MSKFAVIKTGGKQYKVAEGQTLKLEKLPAQEGGEVTFDKVLLAADESKTEIGRPYIKDAQVKAKIIKQGRARKIIIIKFNPKKRYKKKQGHRQSFSQVQITQISS